MKKKTEKKDVLKQTDYWNKDRTIWVQPPVKIKHGDLVEIICTDVRYSGTTLLGRYIGKGKGVAVIPAPYYSRDDIYVTGFVTNRGLDRNPKLVSDEDLFHFIED
jgi:hypothetical protein